MNPLIKYGVAVAMALVVLFGAYSHGVTVTTAHYEAVIVKANTDHARQLASLEASARADEQARAATMHQIDQQTIKGQNDEISKRDRTIADYRGGALRLRDKFTCVAGADQRVPGTAASTGQRDAASAGGLQQPDIEFLVRLASQADQAVTQLAACQAVVRTDRDTSSSTK